MHIKKINISIVLLLTLLLMSACSGIKNVAYFQKMGTNTDSLNQNLKTGIHKAHIKPLDLLSITVVTTQPETSRIYNLVVPQISENTSNNLTSIPSLQTYLVGEDGKIDFPVFGRIKVVGLTREELEASLQEKLVTAFNDEHPIITIRITNFSVNVLGEVLRPGKFITTNERLTIFEGIAQAGDMTIYGRRDVVKVLRENSDGIKKYITVNLNDENIINSPAYYLEQNDVVYVEPNSAKSRTSKIGAAETLSVSALSILISLTSIVVSILK